MSSTTSTNRYMPDYLTTPGEVLEDHLEGFGMTQAELATRTGLTKKTINEIVKGKSPITPETALKLERTLNRPAQFWNNLESQYQEEKVRLRENRKIRPRLEWLEKVPTSAMINNGWINSANNSAALLEEVLRFFGIASPDQWEAVWQNYQVEFRQTQRFQACEFSVSAWLRQGDIQAQQIPCAPYDKNRFQQVLKEARGLTRKEPGDFLPKLEKLCSSAGIAVVFVPELPKCRVFGATRWHGNNPLIQLSLRYKSNDHLWFTFFHEAGHILKHGKKDVFIKGNGPVGKEEKEDEANQFAKNHLISPAAFNRFKARWDGRSLAPVEIFAEEIGIAPGIIVGRLQHEGLLPRNTGNKLKIWYKWT